MFRLEHIGIAISNLEEANKLFTKLLGTSPYKTEEVISEKTSTTFYEIDNTKIELLLATEEASVIHKFIDRRGEGIHHIAFSVANIYLEIERLQQLGFEFINNIPKEGADNKLICFLHPRSTNGILVELCQENK